MLSVLSLAWNGIGVVMYLLRVSATDVQLQGLPVAEQEFYESIPTWATAGFAVAVFGAFVGSITLLMRRRIAELLFIISLLGLFLQNLHAFVMGRGVEVFGPSALGLPATVLLVAIGLFFLARLGTARGWLT